MRHQSAWLLCGFALFGFLRRRRMPDAMSPKAAEADPRAEELRRKLAESRSIADERDEFEGAETPIDQAVPVADPDDRRRAVHDAAREAARQMRDRAS
jgi:hypothetical protein